MLILALDTSSSASAALVERADEPDAVQAVRARRSASGSRWHAEVLAPLVTDVLKAVGVEKPDAVAVGIGPGPYTGLRVGIASAFGYGLGWDVPVYGVVSLDALALQATDRAAGHDLVVATDARRREVYWARYSGTDAAGLPQRTAGPAVVRPADAPAEMLAGDPVRIGAGFALYPDVLGSPADVELLEPKAAAVGATALRKLAAGLPLPDPEPEYLRRPDAAEPKRAKRVLP